jgi:hypothetical protein
MVVIHTQVVSQEEQELLFQVMVQREREVLEEEVVLIIHRLQLQTERLVVMVKFSIDF